MRCRGNCKTVVWGGRCGGCGEVGRWWVTREDVEKVERGIGGCSKEADREVKRECR